MKRMTKRLLSLLLCVMMLVTMLPVSAFATEPGGSQQFMDSGTPPQSEGTPKHWLQQYQEAVLAQLSASPQKMRAMSAQTSTPDFRLILWASGEENRLTFANGAYSGSPMPRISLNGKVAFCGEWNGQSPEGEYIQTGTGNNPAIKQILANYDNSGKSDADYAAAQAGIWAELMGTTIISWGACPGKDSADEILNGTYDYSDLKYNYLEWGGGTQNLITYNTEPAPPLDPDEYPEDKYRIEVTTNTKTETEVRNRKTYEYSDGIGQLTIRKHDQDGRSLDGALFDIDVAFTDGTHTTVQGWEVDNGARLFTWTHPQDNHDPATVTVTEVEPPKGYEKDPRPQTAVVAPTYTRVTHVETWTVTIVTETTSSTVIEIETGNVVAESESSSSAETESDPQVEEFTDFIEGDRETALTFTNRLIPCDLLIRKVDATDGHGLEGAVFELYEGSERDKQKFLGDFISDGNGQVTVNGLESNRYYTIVESQPPYGYFLDEDDVQTVLVKPDALDHNLTVVFQNMPKPKLLLTKVDADTGERLPGAVFRVSRRSSAEYVDVTTGEDGTYLLENLEQDWYEIYELRSPTGYTTDDTHYDVELIPGKTSELVVKNRKRPTLTIKKIDSMTLQPLEGVVFEISVKDGKSLGQFSTNTEGKIVLEDTDPNQIYLVKEVRALPGYLADDTVHEFTLKEAENGVIKLTNTPEHPLIISKKDAITGEPIPDTVFLVSHSDGRLVGEYRTGSNGMATVTGKDVVPGWYLVKETKANLGYIASSETKMVELKLSAPAVVEFVNNPRTGLQIRKVDDVTGEPLAGVQFKVTEVSGAVVGTYTTDADGVINIPDREEGWVQVTEVKPLDGYKPDPASRNVELVSGKLSILEYRNQPYPTLKIVKLDAATRQPLEGVKIRVYDRNHREIGTFVTNRLGQILLSGMDGGETLYVQEVEALPGYELDETVHEVTLAWGQTSTVEILNKQKATLRIKKVDAETKAPIYGVVFNLYDSRNNLLGEYTTDQNGIIEFSKELPAGKYRLKEIKAEGYVVDPTIRTIEVKSGETTEVTIENRPMRGKIQIIKKAADDNPITKDKSGALLEGATFEVYDKSLNVVDTITTDSKGTATTKALPLGTYGLKEVTAPEHYLLNDKVFYATLKVHDDLVRFEVLNKSEDVDVSVEKRGNREALAGDIMSYDFSSIRNDSNIPLEEFYLHDQLPTDAVRLGKIVTGTWSERLTYDITYRTNKKDSCRTLASGLSSKTSHTLDCGREALGLAAGEYVTDIRFEFGTVQPGFHEETKPTIYVTALANLGSGYRIVNRADVGGRTGDEWITAKDSWITVVWGQPKGKLPNTGIGI